MTLKVKAIEELLRFKDIVGFVVGRRLDGQQIEHRVEDVMLLEHLGQVSLVVSESVRGPYQERYLVLHLWCQFHRYSVHKHVVLAERLAVV